MKALIDQEVYMEHCEDHSGNQQRLKQLEANVIDLYSKYENVRTSVAEILVTLSTQYVGMQASLKETADAVTRMEGAMQKHLDADTYHLSQHREEMDEIKAKVDEFDKFSWFRNGLNKIRDNFLIFVIGGLLAILSYIVASGANIFEALKRIGG